MQNNYKEEVVGSEILPLTRLKNKYKANHTCKSSNIGIEYGICNRITCNTLKQDINIRQNVKRIYAKYKIEYNKTIEDR